MRSLRVVVGRGISCWSALLVGSEQSGTCGRTASEDGGNEPGKVYLGMRAGFAPLTQ